MQICFEHPSARADLSGLVLSLFEASLGCRAGQSEKDGAMLKQNTLSQAFKKMLTITSWPGTLGV